MSSSQDEEDFRKGEGSWYLQL